MVIQKKVSSYILLLGFPANVEIEKNTHSVLEFLGPPSHETYQTFAMTVLNITPRESILLINVNNVSKAI